MNFRRRFVFLLVPVACFIQALQGQMPYYPDSVWQEKKPGEVHMSAQRLDSAVRLALASETKTDTDLRIANLKAYAREPNYRILGPMQSRGGPAGMVLRHGYVVAKWGDVKRVDMTFSVTKSFLSSVAGLAVDRHLIRSVDDPVQKCVVDDDKFEGPHNSKITWRHLLTQSSDWSGCLFDVCDWADRPPKEGTVEEWKNRKLLEPGAQFEYNDVRVNLLAYSLLQVWHRPLPVVLREKIMDPIGASTTWRWLGFENSFVNVDGLMVQSVSGGGHFGGGLFISAEDQARFGLLFLRKGRWGKEQLLSEQWVNAVQQPSAANRSYGFMWWLNEEGALSEVSKKVYYADGFGGNYIVIDTEHDLVIVCRWLDSSKLAAVIKLVISSVEFK